MSTLFFRLLQHEDKPAALAEAVDALRSGQRPNNVYEVPPESFTQVPGSPFAYWVSENVRRLFRDRPSFGSVDRTAKQGLGTADDFRFVRTWWEVSSRSILDGRNGPGWRSACDSFQSWCRERTFQGKRWVLFAKGGEYSPYYSDLHLVVNWERDGEEIKAWTSSLYGGTSWSRNLRNTEYYYRPGVTWSRRTQLGFNIRVHFGSAVFADKGPVAFLPAGELLPFLGFANSAANRLLISLQMAFGSYEVGVIERSPMPDIHGSPGELLGQRAIASVNLKRDLDRTNEVSHVFHLPALLQVPGTTLADRIASWNSHVSETVRQLAEHQREIDEIAFRLYGIEGEDRALLEGSEARSLSSADGESEPSEEDEP